MSSGAAGVPLDGGRKTNVWEYDWVTLDGLVKESGLPKAYLRRMADENKIPFLQLGGNVRRFDWDDVNEALHSLTRISL